MKTGLKLLALSFFLMAFQCDDDMENPLVFNTFKTSVTHQANFSLNDTIWVTGKISSKVYNIETKDSIFFGDFPFSDEFSVMKLINNDPGANSTGALEDFIILNSVGNSHTFLCDKSNLEAQNALGSDVGFYTYKIGFVPLRAADYLFSFKDATLMNVDRNQYIIQDYLLDSNPNVIGFEECGSYSYRVLNDTNREFYFSVRFFCSLK